MSVKRSQAERTEQTRRLLLTVARAVFTEQGYAGAATEEIVRRAGVTRGALYHHFRDKQDLFRAVVLDMQEENTRRLLETTAAIDQPWERVRAGMQAFLDSCLQPAVQRIMLQDAPAVLGWEEWRAIDARHGFGILRDALGALITAGLIEPQSPDALAHLLLGALTEGGLAIAGAGDVPATRAAVGRSLDRLFDGLRAGPAAPSGGERSTRAAE